MRILYGVQATGNGHITRARAMAEEFSKTDIQIDYLFSGRPKDKLFDMEPFGDYLCYQGLTFVVERGKINRLKTVLNNSPIKAISEIKSLPVRNYDLVITDFEPISAWSAKLRGIPSLGISHQYAFRYKIPQIKNDSVSELILKYFAPADEYLGVHWHQFEQPILPPISQPVTKSAHLEKNKILVYLPFVELDHIKNILGIFYQYTFYIYHDICESHNIDNLHIRPLSCTTFHKDLATCTGVICNTGFTLISEAIQHGKNILTMPLQGQVEQLSNAKALKELGLSVIINDLDVQEVGAWLKSIQHTFIKPVDYPNVAEAIVSWITGGMQESKEDLVARIWNSTRYNVNSNIKGNYFYAPLN